MLPGQQTILTGGSGLNGHSFIALVRQTTSVEPLIGLAVLVTWLGIKVFAARRVVRGHHRFAWVFFAPALFGMVFVVWLAIRSFAAQPLLAIILGLVGIPSLVLLLRTARQRASHVLPSDPTWELSSAHFDYIVWMAIGLPLVLVTGLLLLLIGGALGTSK